ncbi:protein STRICTOSIDINE SYNTHASE-LIKE 10-like isoform X1 [Dendrobium catenatum]|uniref:protein STRICTOSIDINE SYNTHASE-LIKE 10-like isoform X1 n=1 Tax=Dendrobium catenatum TaxID=906689 RepID=UPI0009F1B747|nr:protein STRICTOSIDINE SYNTHASE-LIKE 10-like isoform X1 [Dendrobium catenatum]
MKKNMLLSALMAVAVSFFSLTMKDYFSLYQSPAENGEESRLKEAFINGGAVGPESLAFDKDGEGPYTGVSDGRILKWQGDDIGWIEFSSVSPSHMLDECRGSQDPKQEYLCGRPLGLCFCKKTGKLYVADAYFGLLIFDNKDKVPTTVSKEAGAPFYFTNALDIDQETGVIYFTVSSAKFRRSEFLSAIITGDNTGRLMQYDSTTQKTQILLSNLSFPNGVALSSDGSFLLIAESTNCRILRYWLQNSSFEVFFQLPGFPDNIRRSPRGGFWIALHSRRSTIEKWLLSLPWIKKAFFYGSNLFPSSSINGMMQFLKRMPTKGVMAMRLDEDGNIIEVLKNPGERKMVFISEVHEMNDSLWIGSVMMPFFWRYKI